MVPNPMWVKAMKEAAALKRSFPMEVLQPEYEQKPEHAALKLSCFYSMDLAAH